MYNSYIQFTTAYTWLSYEFTVSIHYQYFVDVCGIGIGIDKVRITVCRQESWIIRWQRRRGVYNAEINRRVRKLVTKSNNYENKVDMYCTNVQ